MINYDKYLYVNICDYLNRNESELGEEALNNLFSIFSCPMNSDVEIFLKQNAIEFAKKSQSITYLVFSNTEVPILLGYFALTIKPLTIRGDAGLSRTVIRKIARVSEYDYESGTFSLAAYLIAQIGKNYAVDKEKRISGVELMNIALHVIMDIKYQLGGMVVFLEAENEPKLLSFYESPDVYFRKFDKRQSKSYKTEEHTLIQLLRIL